MKRENFLLVTVTGCTGLARKGTYKIGVNYCLSDKELGKIGIQRKAPEVV